MPSHKQWNFCEQKWNEIFDGKKSKADKAIQKIQRKISRMHCMNRRAQKNYDSFPLNIIAEERAENEHQWKNSAFVAHFNILLNKSDGKIIKIISLVSHSLVGDATIQNTRCTMQCVLVFSHGQPKMKEKKEITWTLVYIIQLLHKKWLVFIREKIHSKRSWNCFKYNCIEKERKQKEKQPPPLAGVSLNSSATFAELDAQVRECWWFYLKDYFYALCAADEFFSCLLSMCALGN